VVRSEAETAASKAKAEAKRRKVRGAQRRPERPNSSTKNPKDDGSFTPALVRITGWLDALLHLIAGVISLTYVVLDGHFGNHNALQTARQCGMHLIAKLRCDAALYFPYTGPYAGRGRHRQYGPKIDSAHLPAQYLKEPTVEGHIQSDVYQAQLLHKEFPQPLNVVIIAKTDLRTQARAHVVLFSSDLDLVYAPRINYYGLRFQIEFNFRDTQQY